MACQKAPPEAVHCPAGYVGIRLCFALAHLIGQRVLGPRVLQLCTAVNLVYANARRVNFSVTKGVLR
jgi:hypothetical protein